MEPVKLYIYTNYRCQIIKYPVKLLNVPETHCAYLIYRYEGCDKNSYAYRFEGVEVGSLGQDVGNLEKESLCYHKKKLNSC
jgi:hypothetical protein